ncbi:MAG: hypothetical protein D6734_08010, partial [Candidatus Schekmanbacteria bacterium]
MMKKTKRAIYLTIVFSFLLILIFNSLFYLLKPTNFLTFFIFNLLFLSLLVSLSIKMLNLALFNPLSQLREKFSKAPEKNDNKRTSSDEAVTKNFGLKEFENEINSYISFIKKKSRLETTNQIVSTILSKLDEIEGYDFNHEKDLISIFNENSEKAMKLLDETLGISSEEVKKLSEAASIATQSLKTLSETIDGINKIASSFEETEFSISSLYKKNSEIKELLSEIEGQINFSEHLALNSAIEAARFGEKGRSFTVISGEIKKLAKEISTITKTITKQIDDTAEEIQNAVDRLDNGNRKVERGISLGNNSAKSMLKLVDVIDSAKDVSSQISKKIQMCMATFEKGYDLSEFNRKYRENIKKIKNSLSEILDENKPKDQEKE